MPFSDVNISSSTLVTILVVLAIIALVVWILNHFHRRGR